MVTSKADIRNIVPIAHFPPGGALGAVTVEKCCIIEEQTGLTMPDLYPMAVGDSVGGIIAGSLYYRDPENPDRPKLTSREFADLFYQSIPIFVNIPPGHTLKHVMHFAFQLASRLKPVDWTAGRMKSAYNAVARQNGWPERDFNIDKWLVVDRSASEDILHARMGNATMKDLLGTVVIGSRVIYPRMTTFDFVKLDPEMFPPERIRAPLVSMPDQPLIPAMLASSAVPTFFPFYRMASTGNVHHDAVGFRNHTHTLMNLREALPEGYGFSYSLIGIFEDNPDLPSDIFEKLNIVDIQDIIGMFSGRMHDQNAKEDFFKCLEFMTGGLAFDNSTLYERMENSGYPKRSPLVTSTKQVSALREVARRDFDARYDHHMRGIDLAVEAREVRLGRDPGAAFTARLERERADGDAGRRKARVRPDGFLEAYENGAGPTTTQTAAGKPAAILTPEEL